MYSRETDLRLATNVNKQSEAKTSRVAQTVGFFVTIYYSQPPVFKEGNTSFLFQANLSDNAVVASLPLSYVKITSADKILSIFLQVLIGYQ